MRRRRHRLLHGGGALSESEKPQPWERELADQQLPDEEATEVPPHRPLQGVVVVDLSRHLPGPLVSRLLADLGAQVVKVEEPRQGDPSRQAPPLVDGESSLAALLLGGHRSIALDLKKETAQGVLARLLEDADVLLESFRPGALARLGFDSETLKQRFPSLVVCSVTGWGQDGPYAARAGHDLTYQALAGVLASGSAMPAVQTADIVAAWSAALSITAALFRRRSAAGHRGESGCFIDQSLFDAAGHAGLTIWAAEADGPTPADQPLMLSGALPCYDLYRTQGGGRLALAALEPHFWRRFCELVGRKDWILQQFSADPKVRRDVAELIAGRPRDAWMELFEQHDVPIEAVLSPSEAAQHPQMQARGWLQRAPDGPLRLSFPARFDGRRPDPPGELAKLGAHTDELVEQLGLGADLSRRKRRRGGVGRRFSLRAWLTRHATDWLAKRRNRG